MTVISTRARLLLNEDDDNSVPYLYLKDNDKKEVCVMQKHNRRCSEEKDCNGKKIYERDVVIKRGICECDEREVFFKDAKFSIQLHRLRTFDIGDFPGDYEVVGNLYDNPELKSVVDRNIETHHWKKKCKEGKHSECPGSTYYHGGSGDPFLEGCDCPCHMDD